MTLHPRFIRRALVGGAVMATVALSGPAALATVSSDSSATSAAAASNPPPCPGGSVCFFTGSNFDGSGWEWTANSGYRDMPSYLHDNVGSFVASTDACFINWGPTKQTRQTHNGDWRRSYGDDFGGEMDGVGPGKC